MSARAASAVATASLEESVSLTHASHVHGGEAWEERRRAWPSGETRAVTCAPVGVAAAATAAAAAAAVAAPTSS
jgi:hypothetical protein